MAKRKFKPPFPKELFGDFNQNDEERPIPEVVGDLDLLQAVEVISQEAEDSQLSDTFRKRVKPFVDYISAKMDLTDDESILFAVSTDLRGKDEGDISRYLDLRQISFYRYRTVYDSLVRKGLLERRRGGNPFCDGDSFYVPNRVIDSVLKNEKFVADKTEGISALEFFLELGQIFEMRDENDMPEEDAWWRIESLMEGNGHLHFVKRIRSYKLEKPELAAMLIFSHLFVNNKDENLTDHDLQFFFERKAKVSMLVSSISCGYSPLIQNKLLEYKTEDGFLKRDRWQIPAETKADLFSELNLASLEGERRRNDLLKHSDILAKRMYYDESVATKIDELERMLEKDRFDDICQRMKDAGFRNGFACLFYGAPGTGKTETVLQLARKSGRDIMQVNLSNIKSCWVGESEKNIKRIFDNYRKLVRDNELTPILLFNEADGIIGKRLTNPDRSVDKMENTIQNIILQEMETLEGILIATTNLAENMDSAFERRFLYKIKFGKPSADVKKSIWKEKLPIIDDSTAKMLASKYDFSGGQIDNVASRYTIEKILNGEPADLYATLVKYCDDERIDNGETRRIGFA